jgi:LmeA-like phospholipid-binding
VRGAGSFGGWDPFRPLDSFASLWSATSQTAGPAAMYRSLFETARGLLVGRTFTVRTTSAAVQLTLTELDAQLEPLALSVGQLGDVRIVAVDLTWAEYRIERAVAVARNVHVRPATIPVLVAAPIELTVTVSAATVGALVQRRVPWLSADIEQDAVEQDAVPTVRWRRKPDLGHAEVDIRPDGSTLWLRLRAVNALGRRWPVPARLPAYPIRLRQLPSGLRLTRIEPGPGVLHLHGVIPEWRKPMPTGRLNDLLRQIRSASKLLDVSKWTRRRSGDAAG